ncbi:MAG: DUF4169 family protein [Paracoccaceae bacterium]|jgi:hypothetical protein|nr:DUF4169 family protein [Marinovum sp.]MBT4871865.1 DUF4169 family protein [Marinovum sp.]MBT6506458.1 DUF4169 family protein [Marinovum sp.]MDG1425276.1 DUF4169 family protein [Paracoccaceae bacterium]MDG2231692.1 DUF4169 family protein [Paracoccaceae bacterium]
MPQPVNLNRARKQKARAEKQARATENSVKFGIAKVEKTALKKRLRAESLRLDQHRRDR